MNFGGGLFYEQQIWINRGPVKYSGDGEKFADEVVAETVTDLDARHAFPEEEVKQCAEMGF